MLRGRKITQSEVEHIAKGLLVDFKELPGFKDAEVTAIHPIYDISGKNITYYEVKFSSPRQRNNGYAIISATTEDFPVVEFSESGLTHYETFRRKIRKDFRMVRFGPQYITAEDDNGELLEEIGVRPVIIPKGLQRHVRGEGKSESGPPELETPKINIRRITRMKQPQDYKAYKLKFRKPVLDNAKIKNIKAEWTHALKPIGNPGCVREHFSADGSTNHPYYLQIPKNTPPNDNNHKSGCGATAWMNIFGWHDLNWIPELLTGQQIYNNSYIKNLTMELHDYLGTFAWPFSDKGFTWPGDMPKGYNFARERLYHDYSYWYRYDWWNTDENWVFEVARSLARAKRPFIVGFFQNLHYAIGYQIAECKTHGWKKHSMIRIYPALKKDDSKNKWIPKGTIFAIYGVYDFVPIFEFAGISNPQELEVHIEDSQANRMFIYTGIAIFNSRGGTGKNWVGMPISFDVGRQFTATQFKGAVAQVALASIANESHAVNAGWSVNSVEASRSSNSGKTRVAINCALRDIDGYLHRIAYKVTVRAKL